MTKLHKFTVLLSILLLGAFNCRPIFAADNQHDHNTHQEIDGPVLPLPTIGQLLNQQSPPVDPVTDKTPTTGCHGGSGTGSPVLLASGEFIWSSVDVMLVGRPGLHLTRSYRAFDTRDGIFGKGWSTHCEKALLSVIDYEASAEPTRAYIYRLANGQRFRFAEVSEGQFVTPDGLNGLSLEVNTDQTVTMRSISGAEETYNSLGQLISESDRNGNVVNYTYVNGTLTQIADTNGRSLTLTMDSTGHVSRVTDHTGRRWTYDYNADGSLSSVTDPMGASTNYEYTNVTRAANSTVYPAITKITDATGVVLVSVTYSENGTVTSYTEGENEYTYTTQRGLIYKTDSQNTRWSYTLDELGRKTKIVYPTGRSELFEYDANSNLVKFTDRVGTEFSSTYDNLGRMMTSTTPDGTTQYEYQTNTNWLTEVTSPSGRVNTIEYDSRGNPIKMTDAAGHETQLSWSAKGDLIAVTDALGGTITSTYNAIGLPTSITDQLNRSTEFSYDNRGNLVSVTNALGNTSTFAYDVLDRTINSQDALDHQTNYELDVVGRLLSLTDARGGVTRFDYDSFGRQISETRPDDSVIAYSYRSDNLIDVKTDPREITQTYDYVRNTRLLTSITGAASEYMYFRYDNMNRMTQATYNGSLLYQYDSMSRVTQESFANRRIGYTYNSEGEITEVTAQNEEWLYEYDERGLLVGFTTPEGTHQFVNDALGRRVSHTLPNGSTNTFSYDAASQLIEQDYSQTSGEVLTYSYDALGQVTDITSSVNTPWNYQYDAINRLMAATHDQNYSYEYDELGNRLESGGVYDLFNKLLENDDYTFEYDAAGSLIAKVSKVSGEQTSYQYNAFNRLIGLQIAPSAEATPTYSALYAYDANGRRIEKREGSAYTYYQWKGTDLIGEYGGNTLVKSYRYAGGYAATEFSDVNGTYQVQTNHLDTPINLTDADNSVAWSQLLSPYGVNVDSAQNVGDIEINQRFPGQYSDISTGLSYNYQRDYDHAEGRYIEADPVGLIGGSNLYLYANANPTNSIDPSGEFSVPGAALGAGLNIAVQFGTNYRKSGGDVRASIRGISATDVIASAAFGFVTPGIAFKNAQIPAGWGSSKALYNYALLKLKVPTNAVINILTPNVSVGKIAERFGKLQNSIDQGFGKLQNSIDQGFGKFMSNSVHPDANQYCF